jgi:hypothetical protein
MQIGMMHGLKRRYLQERERLYKGTEREHALMWSALSLHCAIEILGTAPLPSEHSL